MKKLVIKTTLITLASILVAMGIAFGAIALFAPGFTADIFNGVGNYSASVFFYEKQYKKTGDIDDLATLVDKIDYEKENQKSEEYLSLLVNHADYESFCDLGSNGSVTTEEYYTGNFALVLAENGKFNEALDVAKNYVLDNGYTKNNPFRILVVNFSMTSEQKIIIKSKITSCTQNVTDTVQLGYITQDLLV